MASHSLTGFRLRTQLYIVKSQISLLKTKLKCISFWFRKQMNNIKLSHLSCCLTLCLVCFVFICRFHSNPDNSCSYLTDNFKSRCLQIFNYHRLLSWDNTRGLHVDIFKVSQIAQQNIRTPSTETINIAHRLGANMLFLSHRRLSRRIPADQHIPRRQWAQ